MSCPYDGNGASSPPFPPAGTLAVESGDRDWIDGFGDLALTAKP
ncbi:MAG: hypothetical protein NW220_06110 [Leptolyngbyaceae cyanobacterium bins.349]|nr:hypothetical protein [Leptolyngbyaceae cyanobacterium bins.349]